ncbi:MAG: ATP phosphoribosyltransferase regulatory subunit [Clostridia bacterium]|nr:ATP phosphoribosyltransferase regulatory subunit [Clostridia bacterium]
MDFKSVLTREELVALSLRSIYASHGYTQYRMSKFEEYDLYAKNKDFLVSDNIITFTDTDGRLLALKPDVTLSIIKNDRDSEGIKKLYYNENVYRPSRGTRSFRELMQVGLECMGEVGETEIAEVILLAKMSLDAISPDNVLEISHLDIVSGVLSAFNISEEGRGRIYTYLAAKNERGIESVCEEEGLAPENTALVTRLATLYGEPGRVLPELSAFCLNDGIRAAVDSLSRVLTSLEAGGVRGISLDFSLLSDMSYYNGIAIKGFVSGIPTGVLSGGQYDRLMKKMNRKSRAVGFAVYLDEISKLSCLGE